MYVWCLVIILTVVSRTADSTGNGGDYERVGRSLREREVDKTAVQAKPVGFKSLGLTVVMMEVLYSKVTFRNIFHSFTNEIGALHVHAATVSGT